jgi:hypothetical protein
MKSSRWRSVNRAPISPTIRRKAPAMLGRSGSSANIVLLYPARTTAAVGADHATSCRPPSTFARLRNIGVPVEFDVPEWAKPGM